MNEKTYYDEIDRIFTQISSTYDSEILLNKSSYVSYLITIDYLLKNSKGVKLALDIGCGTGLQAIPLALNGIHVVAIDVSEGMLNVLKEKIKKLGIKNIETYKLPASGIEKLVEIYGENTFDLAYSYFGPINAEPNIERLSFYLYKLLRNEGVFLVSVINRWCLYDLITLKPRKKFGIYKSIKFSLLNPLEIKNYFRNFKIEEIVGVGIIFPHRNSKIRNKKLIYRLANIEIFINKIFPFNYLGSDFIVKFVK